MKLSIIIPAYNEEENIYKTVSELHRCLIEEGINFEIIVINDNSNDQTESILIETKKEIFE